jgi:hypothetical protein
MSRSIDFLLSLDNADEQRVGVAGLSGGGWQTILISSLDPRVTLCNPVAGYSSFRTRIENYSDLGDSEQTPVDLGITADYAQLTALMAPRAALLTYNEKDNCCFASGHALDPLVQAASPVYKLLGHENRLRTHVNTDPGTHNFLLDNRQALYRMIRDQWYQGNESEFATTELPLEAEIKTREVLDVSLPSNNVDFHSLALSLSESLPHSTPRPDAVSERQTWRKARIKELRSVVKPIDGDVTATEISKVTMDGVTIVRWQLQIGKDWLIPAVEFSKADSKSAALVISDDGRKSAAEHVQRLLSDGHRVIVVDPFYFGECSIEARSYLWALMISTVGERPLGVQAGQIMSVAKWMQKSTGVSEVKLVTHGSRASVAGLIATVLDSKAIAQIEEHSPMESLKTVLQTNLSFDQAPALFCADLLAITDLPQLRELLPAAQQ